MSIVITMDTSHSSKKRRNTQFVVTHADILKQYNAVAPKLYDEIKTRVIDALAKVPHKIVSIRVGEPVDCDGAFCIHGAQEFPSARRFAAKYLCDRFARDYVSSLGIERVRIAASVRPPQYDIERPRRIENTIVLVVERSTNTPRVEEVKLNDYHVHNLLLDIDLARKHGYTSIQWRAPKGATVPSVTRELRPCYQVREMMDEEERNLYMWISWPREEDAAPDPDLFSDDPKEAIGEEVE